MKLIIESGATKSDWRLTEKGKQLSGGLFHGMTHLIKKQNPAIRN